MQSYSIIPIILCGGSGSRLWPLSRETFPKQFLRINSKNKLTLLQNTQNRIKDLKNVENPILVCNEDHRFIVAEQMREINTVPSTILLEPEGKNTAAAITLAALSALEKISDPILLVLSSDHEIKNKEKFHKVIESGIKYVNQNKLVTFGVIPNSPETGYGYIQSDIPFNESELVGTKISRFIEKPNFELVQELIKDRRFTWNSGIFMFKAKTIIEEIQKYSPNTYNSCLEAIEKSKSDLDFQRLDKKSFKNCPNISIDIAVMEKTSKGIVIPLDAKWSDIGSWKAVWELSKKDDSLNYKSGNVILSKVNNSYVRGEDRLVVGIGLKNLIVVETNDAILIADKEHTQDIKDIVSKLKKENIPEGQQHRRIYRPWGNYFSIAEDSNWQVKLITVKPGETLSLQKHKYRSEHWIVVNGTALVEIEDKKFQLERNQSTYIPKGAKHRLSNLEKNYLNIIEVQSGDYLGEDDIIRFEDKYGRSN